MLIFFIHLLYFKSGDILEHMMKYQSLSIKLTKTERKFFEEIVKKKQEKI